MLGDRDDILQLAIAVYGEPAQTDMCLEEMSELAKALLKLRRFPGDRASGKCHALLDDIREEIADVQIMLDQMKLLYGYTEAHEEGKLARLEKRLHERGCA